MSRYILLAETGSDISKEIAKRYQIEIVPMHISFSDETLDDGTFPVEKVFEYYNKTGILPKTSACNPEDFHKAFDKVHKLYPDKHILHLAYSAVTTSSYQSAIIAGENRDYVTSIDTRNVSAGQAMIVIEMAEYLEKNPDATILQVKDEVEKLIKREHMGFFPGDLLYLKAGGRVSNPAYLSAKLLKINPLIEIIDGKLVSTIKYRGSKSLAATKLVTKFSERYNLCKERLAFVYTSGLDEEIKEKVEQVAIDCGFKDLLWIKAGCVVSTHGGPGAFGVIGFEKEF